jgi:very-short-patch-repair endonuclease
METRLRMALIRAKLPRPSVQAKLRDAAGNFVGRADLYYPDRRLVIEYDGENHRDRLVADLRRQNTLVNAGYHLLRFTIADMRTPGAVAAQVRLARARLPRYPVSPDEPT